MTLDKRFSRRDLLRTSQVLSLGVLAGLPSFGEAWAAGDETQSVLDQNRGLISELEKRADSITGSAPSSARSLNARQNNYGASVERLLDVMDAVPASGARSLSEAGQRRALTLSASGVLRQLRRAENPNQRLSQERRVFSCKGADAAAAEYVRLFQTCVIRDDKKGEIAKIAARLARAPRKTIYEQVSRATNVPWFVIGVMHTMECSMDLNSHLHNGDPLAERTVQVPAKRPKVWDPPTDWVSSAIDAIAYDKLDGKRDWDLATTLFRLEIYNGCRSRKNGINTPYLWSFSNHYTKGKFVKDNVWSPTAVSRQAGAAVILKHMAENGDIPPVNEWGRGR